MISREQIEWRDIWVTGANEERHKRGLWLVFFRLMWSDPSTAEKMAVA